MTKELTSKLMKDAKSLLGKKLIWIGYDEDQERFYLFFEGMSAIAVEGLVPTHDGKEIATKILAERLDDAQHVIALKNLLTPDLDAPKLETELEVEVHGGSVVME